MLEGSRKWKLRCSSGGKFCFTSVRSKIVEHFLPCDFLCVDSQCWHFANWHALFAAPIIAFLL
jgi:hypothetical protein